MKVSVPGAVGAACMLAAFSAFALLVGDADYRATPIGWVALFAELLLVAASWAYVRIAARRVSVAGLAALDDCKRGCEVPFAVTVRNGSPFPLFAVDVAFSISDASGAAAQASRARLSLGGRAAAQVPFRARFDHVGRFYAGIDEVVVGDFLGLFTAACVREAAGTGGRCEVCVTPNLAALANVHFANEALEDVPRPVRSVLADSMDYAYARPYVVGDPLKTIHWKLSARTDSYQTRLFEQSVNPGVAVVIDLSVPDAAAEDALQLIDCVVECGLSLADFACKQGLDLEIHYCDKDGAFRVLHTWNPDAALDFVRSMPVGFTGAQAHARSAELLERVRGAVCRQPNVVVCTANIDRESLGRIVEVKLSRRHPLAVAAVPRRLVDRDRERYVAPLGALEAAGIRAVAASDVAELAKVAL